MHLYILMLFKSWWVDLWFCLCSSSWNVRCITARQLNTRSNRLQSKQMNMDRTIANATEGNWIECAVEYIFAVAEMSVRCVMHNSHAYAPVQREYVTCGCVQIYSTENRKWLKYNMQQVAPILHSLCYSLSIARDVLDWLQWVCEPWALGIATYYVSMHYSVERCFCLWFREYQECVWYGWRCCTVVWRRAVMILGWE